MKIVAFRQAFSSCRFFQSHTFIQESFILIEEEISLVRRVAKRSRGEGSDVKCIDLGFQRQKVCDFGEKWKAKISIDCDFCNLLFGQKFPSNPQTGTSRGGMALPPGNRNLPFSLRVELAIGSKCCMAMNLPFCTLSTMNRGTRSPFSSKVTRPVIPKRREVAINEMEQKTRFCVRLILSVQIR